MITKYPKHVILIAGVTYRIIGGSVKIMPDYIHVVGHSEVNLGSGINNEYVMLCYGLHWWHRSQKLMVFVVEANVCNSFKKDEVYKT